MPEANPSSSLSAAGRVPAALARVDRVMDRLSDGVNAIVVKELRQGVRSRFMLTTIHLLLLAMVAVIGVYLVTLRDTSSLSAGRDLFFTLNLFLFGLCVLFVPLYVGMRFGAERTQQNVDMLYVTTLGPMAIVWGKFLSGAVLMALMFSMAAPFMVLTYMLRGVDVLSIVVILALDFCVLLAALQGALLMMAASVAPLARLGAAVAYVVVIINAMIQVGRLSWHVLYWGGLGDLTAGQWAMMVGWSLAVMLAYHLGVMLVTAAMISAPTANRALPVRLYMTGLWVVGAIALMVVGLYYQDRVPLFLWSAGGVFAFLALAMFAACERDRPGLRVQLAIPRRRWLHWPAFLFYSGSAGGVLWATLMIALCLVVWMSSYLLPMGGTMLRGGRGEEMRPVIVFVTYGLTYILLAVAVVRYIGRGRLRTELTFGVVVGLAAIGVLAPLVVAMIADPRYDPENNLWGMIGNPMAAMIAPKYVGTYLVTGLVALSVSAVISLPWLIGQVRAFRRVEGKGAADMLAGTSAEPAASPEASTQGAGV